MFNERFDRLNFRTKMAVAIMAACSTSLLVAMLALTAWQHRSDQLKLVDRNIELAQVLANNVESAVLFADEDFADETASSVSRIDSIEAVTIMNASGVILGEFLSPDAGADIMEVPEVPTGDGQQVTTKTDQIHVTMPIKLDDGETIGWVQLVARQEALLSVLQQYISVGLWVFAVSMVIALILAKKLQAKMFSPFDQLMRAMRHTRTKGDYSSRVPLPADPDVAHLVSDFNAMLEQLESWDAELLQTMSELSSARDFAEKANTAKSEFLANMSHELRTPLNAIIAYADLVREDLEEQQQSQMVEDMAIINKSAHHLLNLINGILDFAKIEAGHTSIDAHAFDLDDLLDDIVATLEPLVKEKDNTLLIQKDGPIGEVIQDSVKIRQCLINLISNATKFTSEGHIVVSVEEGASGALELRVSDTGIGMSQDQLSKLFQPFIQADNSTTRKYGGTGLGLTITKTFIELLGGSVSVQSMESLGSTFTLRFPRRYDGPAQKDDAVTGEALPIISELPIALVVDDEPTASDILQRWLEPLGYNVQVANNGEQALAMARALSPAVILLDLGLPLLDGWGVLEQMGEDDALRLIPVIVVTIDDRRQLCLDHGASEFLSKPVDREQLKNVLAVYTNVPGGSVLLVEDDDDTAQAYARGLSQAGYKVTRVRQGLEALERLDATALDPATMKLPFDLVISDLMMPDVDGFTLIEELQSRPHLADIPVLVTTAKDLTAEDRNRLDGRVSRILPKSGMSPRYLASTARRAGSVLAQPATALSA